MSSEEPRKKKLFSFGRRSRGQLPNVTSPDNSSLGDSSLLTGSALFGLIEQSPSTSPSTPHVSIGAARPPSPPSPLQPAVSFNQIERCSHGFFRAGMSASGVPLSHRNRTGEVMTGGIVEITLHDGFDIIACDKGGTSDPFLKVCIGEEKYTSKVHKKTLAPVWDEFFCLPAPTLASPIEIEMWDWNRVGNGNFMGRASVDLALLADGEAHDLTLTLQDVPSGKIRLVAQLVESAGVLTGKSGQEIVKGKDRKKKVPKRERNRVGTLNVVLLEGIDLAVRDEDTDSSDPYVKLQFGKQKRKSSVVAKNLNPLWGELFEFQVDSRDTPLLISVFDEDAGFSDDPMGFASIDLKSISDNISTELTVDLQDVERGQIRLVLTLTWHGEPSEIETSSLKDTLYEAYLNPKNMKTVGIAHVEILSAKNLRAADIGGTSDPFVVIELGNTRLRTPTIFKDLNPVWNKTYYLAIKDICQCLEFTVLDEDRDGSSDFLGKAILPLLSVKPGVHTLYLKDESLLKPCKAPNPTSLKVKVNLEFWPHKALFQTLQQAEAKHLEVDPKFKTKLLKENLNRVKAVVMSIVAGYQTLNRNFMWAGTKFYSSVCWILWTLFCLKFEWYFLPVALIVLMMYFFFVKSLSQPAASPQTALDVMSDNDEEDDVGDLAANELADDDEPKQSLRDKIRGIERIVLVVQNVLGHIASFFERWKNLFNWSVPFMSKSWIVLLTIVALLLAVVPMKYVFVFAGIMKYSKVLRKPPGYIGNDEILDFIGRVPNDIEKLKRRLPTEAQIRRMAKKT